MSVKGVGVIRCVSYAVGKLDKGKRLSFCKTSRFSIEENIKNYITLKKYGCRTL